MTRTARARLGGLLAACLGLGVFSLGSPPVHASTPGAGPATCSGLHEVLAFLPADPQRVAAVGAIPSRWKLQLDGQGHADVIVAVNQCRWTVAGTTHVAILSEVLAVLDSSALPEPERSADTSSVMGTPLDLYMVSLRTNDPSLLAWLRDGTGLGAAVGYSPGLDFQLQTGPVWQLTFHAPKPEALSFSQTSSVPFFPVPTFVENFWHQTATGTFRMQADGSGNLVSQYLNWTLSPGRSSTLARIFGTQQISAMCSPTAIPSPLLGIAEKGPFSPGCVGGESGGSTLTKQVLTP